MSDNTDPNEARHLPPDPATIETFETPPKRKSQLILETVAAMNAVKTELEILTVTFPDFRETPKQLAKWQNLKRQLVKLHSRHAEILMLPQDVPYTKSVEYQNQLWERKQTFLARFLKAAHVLLPAEDFDAICQIAESGEDIPSPGKRANSGSNGAHAREALLIQNSTT